MNRPNVLISAFSCNPERGSEPGVGHFFVNQLARHCNLTVLTEEVQNRAAIERRQREDETYASIDFRFIPWPCLDRHGKVIDDRGSWHFYRCLREWERTALGLAMRLTVERRFDLTHHLTMGGYREPGYLWRLPLPFVWGPTGGHVQMPWRYFPMLGWHGCLRHAARNLGNVIHARFHPRVNAAARAASVVVTSSSLDARAFARFQGISATTIAEHGIDPDPAPPRVRRPGRALRIAWSGVHVPRKGLPIFLRALAQLPPDVSVAVEILGEGPETLRWQALASRLGVGQLCRWNGRLPLKDAVRLVSSCDVFALTSLIDATSRVLHESLAHGLPVICHRACGFVEVVDEKCAELVDVRSPAASARAFAAAIVRLATDAAHYNRIAAAAHARARDVVGASRARQMLDVYERVLGRAIVQTPAAAAKEAVCAS